jgi:UDP-apiose/xylose synthase
VDGGQARRTFMHIDDAVNALLNILERPEAAQGRIFNLGHPGNEATIRELARLMREAFAGATEQRSYLDHPEANISAEEFYGEGYDDSDRRLPDIRKARELLNWEPKIALEEALRRIVVEALARHATEV